MSATTPRALPHWVQVPHRAVCSARWSSRCWPTTALRSSATTTSASLPNDTSVVGLLSNNDETHYREEVAQLAEWYGANNLSLNVGKTKEVVIDLSRNSVDHPRLTIDRSTVESVSSTKFQGGAHHRESHLDHQHHVTLQEGTTAPTLSPPAENSKSPFLPPILTTFYRGIIKSVLTSCITVWYGNCSAADRKTLQRTVNTTAKIIGAPLPSILDIFLTRCSSKANSIMKDLTHPSCSLFQLLPSGRQYRSIRARSARLLNSFFPRLWEPWTQLTPPLSETPYKPPTSWNMDHLPPHPPPTLPHRRKNCQTFFVQFQVCYTQVSGPVQATCSNTLSSILTRHVSHITVCT